MNNQLLKRRFGIVDLVRKMPEKKVEEKEEKPYPITITDWIMCLNEEINRYETTFGKNFSFVLSMTAMLIAVASLLVNATFLAIYLTSLGISVNTSGLNILTIVLSFILE